MDNRTIYNCFNTPDGAKVLDWLDTQVSGISMRKTKDGHVDPYATLYANGQQDLVKLIKQRIQDGKLAR